MSALGRNSTMTVTREPASRTGALAPVLVALGAAAIIAGSLLPWSTTDVDGMGTYTVTGWEGRDGIVSTVLGVGVLALAVALYATRRRALRWWAFGLAVAAGLVGLYVLATMAVGISVYTAPDLAPSSIGFGLILLFVGVALAVFGALTSRR